MCLLNCFSRLVVSTDVKYRVVSESIPFIMIVSRNLVSISEILNFIVG